MYKLPLAVLFMLGCGVTVPVAGQEYFPAVATYHSATGDVVLHQFVQNHQLSGLQARGPEVQVVSLPEDLGQYFVDIQENEISWLFFTLPSPKSLLLQGVLPAGLTESQLKADYYIGVVLFDNPELQATQWQYVAVPEGSSLVLASLGSVLLLRRHRLRH